MTTVAETMTITTAGSAAPARLPSGHYVTPTAIDDAVQTHLNPQLPAYPDFVAGMAVRSRLSPDGETLAILTAGQNSLYRPDGTVDVAELDAVHLSLRREEAVAAGAEAGDQAGELARRPRVLTRRQHALRRRRQRRCGVRVHEKLATASLRRRRSPWDTTRRAPPATRGTEASGSTCSRTPAAWTCPPTAARWSSPTTTTIRSASSTPRRAPFVTSTICGRTSPTTKGSRAASAGPSRSAWRSRATTRPTSHRIAIASSSSSTCRHRPKGD